MITMTTEPRAITKSELSAILKRLSEAYDAAEDDDLCESLSSSVANVEDAIHRLDEIEQKENEAEASDHYYARVDYAYDNWRDDHL